MPLTEDFSAFYDSADFGTPAVYTPSGGGVAVTVQGIFDKTYVEPFGQVEGRQTVYRTSLDQFASRPLHDATLVIGGVTYKIKSLQEVAPDGIEILLMLKL